MSGGTGMSVSSWLETAPRAAALALGLGLVFRFVKWAVEFAFARFDVNRSQLGRRLRHVEQELDAYREATMLLIGVVAKIAPENPALLRVSQILSTIAPRATIELDELTRRLNDIPGKTNA